MRTPHEARRPADSVRFTAVFWVVSALLALTVTACKPREPSWSISPWSTTRTCADAVACAELLCGPTSSQGDLLYAATTIRRARDLPKDTVDRLVACTRAELDAPLGHGLPDTSSCTPAPREENADSPQSFSSWRSAWDPLSPLQERRVLAGNDCPPRIHFLLVAAEAWSGDPEGREVLVRASTRPDSWTSRLARRALVAIQDPDAIAARAQDLTSGSSTFVVRAMLDLALAREAARPHVPAIIAAADKAGQPATGRVLPFVLGAIGGDEAVTRLTHDLASPDVDVWTVIGSLERLGKEAAPAGDALREVAAQHFLADVRNRASKAYELVTGASLSAGRQRCPREVKQVANGWIAELSTRTIRFAPAEWDNRDRDRDRRDRRRAAGRCAQLMDKDDEVYIAHPLGTDCLVGVNEGEFGGGVSVRDPRSNKGELLFPGNPNRFIDDGDGTVLVFEGLAHLGLDSGTVHRVWRQNGKWAAELVAAPGANPIGWARDRDGRLLLLAREQERTCRGQYPSYVVLRVGPDRRIEALE
jgi:hypothetical protein